MQLFYNNKTLWQLGLNAGCDPVMSLEEHIRTLFFDGGLLAVYKSGLSLFLWECSLKADKSWLTNIYKLASFLISKRPGYLNIYLWCIWKAALSLAKFYFM